MKLYNRLSSNIRYPVGSNIQQNVLTINEMASFLNTLITGNYPNVKRIFLICRGSSGAIIAGIVANYLIERGRNVDIIHIKKPGEIAHCDNTYLPSTLFGPDDVTVLVDDQIHTGRTVNSILDVIEGEYKIRKLNILCIGDWINKHTWNDLFDFGICTQ